MPATYKFTDYHARLNQEFSIEVAPGQWAAAELVEAKELEYQYAAEGEVPVASFSLVFRMEGAIHLAQKIYVVKQEELGEQQIFLVPLQSDEAGARYEAVFT